MDETIERLLITSRTMTWQHFGRTIKLFVPSFSYYQNSYYHSSSTDFPSISITGKSCGLNCKHCGGRVLDNMISAPTPEKLMTLCRTLKKKGVSGCLISGGCLPDGSVPLQRFIHTIKTIKEELGFKIIVHTGILKKVMVNQLVTARIDAALIDIIGSQETIEEIYNLQVKVTDYESTLQLLQESGIPFVPHVVTGLHFGELRGEINALEMISRYDPQGVVILALIPLQGTWMSGVSPPKPEEVAWILAKARIMMPQTPIALGCMRPKGEHRNVTDVLAVQAGVNAIAFPVEAAIDYAISMNVEIEFSNLCCSQIYEDFL